MTKTPQDIKERAFEFALRSSNCVSISIRSLAFRARLVTNYSRPERQSELTLKKHKLVKADRISSVRTLSH
jgi:hypothetical protein